MGMITWESYLIVGHTEIDARHRNLADRLNELHDATRRLAPREEIGALLTRFRDANLDHNSFEETLMGQVHYQQTTQHRAEHVQQLELLNQLVDGFHNGTREVNTRVLHFLQDWLVSHIVKEDRPLVRFLHEQEVKESGAEPSGQGAPASGSTVAR